MSPSPAQRGPGRAPSLVDVAARAGVSTSLVSRILTGDTGVRAREETRDRVRVAAADIGYVPHAVARSLRRAHAGALGLVVHGLGNPIFSEIVQGAQQRVVEAGDVLLVADADSLTDDLALRQLAGGGRVDGLLWQPATSGGIDDRAALAARWVPVVLLNSRGAHGLPGVHLDDAAAARLAVEHLVALGHRRIGLVGGPADADNSVRRREGYQQGMHAAGLPAPARWTVWGGWSPAAGQLAGHTLLRRQPELTALVAANVVVASGILSAAAELQVSVPAQVSLVALHDLWFAERLSPPLTVVEMPLRRMGWAAADLLLTAAVSTEDSHLVADPPPRLIVRGSTAEPRALP